jgi:hypothetical protein
VEPSQGRVRRSRFQQRKGSQEGKKAGKSFELRDYSNPHPIREGDEWIRCINLLSNSFPAFLLS